MELFLLIAIGLSLISFISIALTKTPPQTSFSTNNLFSESDQPDGLREALIFSDNPNVLAEYPEPEIQSDLSTDGEMTFHEKEILVSSVA